LRTLEQRCSGAEKRNRILQEMRQLHSGKTRRNDLSDGFWNERVNDLHYDCDELGKCMKQENDDSVGDT
jgi:hypothetical protein